MLGVRARVKGVARRASAPLEDSSGASHLAEPASAWK